MIYPTVRLVFNRRKTATKATTASVEIEVCYKRNRKWLSTNVKLYHNEWDQRRLMVSGRMDMDALNNQIETQLGKVRNAIKRIVEGDEEFSFALLESYMSKSIEQTFIEFAEQRIEQRADMRESTRRHHRSWLNRLKEYGKIVYFSDLTHEAIVHYDEWLRSTGMAKITMQSHHKTMKVYVHEAIAFELVARDPYIGMKYERMQASEESIRYLDEEEVMLLRGMNLKGYLAKVRDLFIVQCYTGMAYSDLAKFDFTTATKQGENTLVKDVRQKTGETYYLVLLKPVLEVLDKYNGVLPIISNQKYNAYLKILQEHAGIETKLTTHVGRHTFATMMLNKRVPIEIVAKMMGHSTSKTTEIYAKILGRSVQEAFLEISHTIQ